MSRQDDIFSECAIAFIRNRDPVAEQAIEALDKDVIASLCVKYKDDMPALGRQVLDLLRESIDDAIENDDSVPYNDVEIADRKERARDMNEVAK